MKNKIKYMNEPMGKTKIIEDFLPPPDLLVLKDDKVKVTISLSKESVDFFKKEAKKQSTSYQRMIRKVIDLYASRFQKSH
jgi:hypothetical protein